MSTPERSCARHPHWSGMSNDCAFCRAERAELSLVLRRAAREYLGLEERGYWDSGIADAQARALADLLAARDRRVRGEALREAARELPRERHRGKRNDPATRSAISRWLDDRADRIDPAQTAAATEENRP